MDSLKPIASTADLTDRVTDYVNRFWLPAICACGLVANGLNIVVLAQKKAREVELLRNYLAIAVSDFGFLLVEFPIFTFRCGALCSYGYDYGAKVYELYVYLMLGYMFTTFGVLIDITIAYKRLRLFIGAHAPALVTKSSIRLKCIVCVAVSVVLNLPENGIFKVVVPDGVLVTASPVNSTTPPVIIYQLGWRSVLKPAEPMLMIFVIVRGVVTFLALSVLNIVILYKFTAHINRTQSIYSAGEQRTRETKENRMTLMIIVMCLVYMVGNTLDAINLCLFVVGEKIYSSFNYLTLIGNTLLFASHGCNILILLKFNSKYRRCFKSLFERVRMALISRFSSLTPLLNRLNRCCESDSNEETEVDAGNPEETRV